MPFYKLDGETLLEGNSVAGTDLALDAEHHADYTYPVQGWYWYNNLDDARLALTPLAG